MYQYKRRRQAAYIYCYAVGTSVRLRMYDGNWEVVGFRKGTDSYYYLKNMQGDVMQIVNSSGTVVAEYEYDDWGYVTSVSGSLSTTIGAENPFRYRGYYYDNESGFYYLESRYYDPETGRFISADSSVSTGQGLTGNNMFAYCNNDPVSRIEVDGESSAAVLVSGLIGGFFNAMSAISNGGSAEDVAWSFCFGFGTGVLGAALEGARVFKAVVGGLIGAANSIAVQLATDGTVNWGNVACSGLVYTISSASAIPYPLEKYSEQGVKMALGIVGDVIANTSAYTADTAISNTLSNKKTPEKPQQKVETKRKPYDYDYDAFYKNLSAPLGKDPLNICGNRWA